MLNYQSYYTDDITLLPSNAIWRILAKLVLPNRVLLFCFFWLRKALHWRFRANYGLRCPRALTLVPTEILPLEFIDQSRPYLKACSDAGFQWMYHTRPEYIGNKQTHMSVLLDSARTSSVTITWISMSLGGLSRTELVFGCHSVLQDGTEWHTSATNPQTWIPELFPPQHKTFLLPVSTPPAEILRSHFQRLIDSKETLRRFDRNSLAKHSLHSAQQLFEHLVSLGFYAELTATEVQRLSGQ